MAAIAASAKSKMLNAGKISPGSSARIIRNAGTASSTLGSANMPKGPSKGAFRVIQLACQTILLPLAICTGGNKNHDGSCVIKISAEDNERYQKSLRAGRVTSSRHRGAVPQEI